MTTQEQQADEDQQASEDKDEPSPVSEEERVGQITERIDKARSKAEEAGVLVDEDEEEYVDSGATEEDDDQTIAPPG